MRRGSKHWVLVLVTKGGAPGLALLNAESFNAPYGPAVLQVSSEHRDLLFNAVGRGAALRVVTPAGAFDCVAIEPVLKAGGIFKSKGRLVIWLTDDEHRMPVLMKSKVAIGSISVVLQEARNGA